MALLLSKSELAQTEPADHAAFESPVPTQIVSNGEFNPLPQTAQQRRVEARIKELADTIAPRLGLEPSHVRENLSIGQRFRHREGEQGSRKSRRQQGGALG